MARLHAGDTPVPSAMIGAVDADITSKTVVYGRRGETSISGYLSTPAELSERNPGIIVIHEWWGLNDNIRSMADQLAAEGYAALAVDLYDGKAADTPADARKFMSAVGKAPDAAKHNLRQAFAYLKEVIRSEKVGVIGWCFGGGWSLRTAILLGDGLDACVIYYGRVTTDEEELRAFHAPVLGIFGAEDGGIPVEGVRMFEAVLKKLEKNVTIHLYDGAGHAFANPSGRNYQEKPAKDAWEKTLKFFRQYLTPD